VVLARGERAHRRRQRRKGPCRARPAEAEIDDLAAAWYDDTSDFAAAARAAGPPGDSWVQVCPVRLDLVEEHRCFVLDGSVVATSPYLLADGSTWEPDFDTRADLHHADARRFATEAVDELGAGQPGAYVLDVGLLGTGRWVVIEVNPAWCSGIYGAEPAAAVEVVVEASLTASVSPVATDGGNGSRTRT